jgi:type II pantothenate kinase
MHDLVLSDIEKVMITGAGSSYVTKSIYSLKSETIQEFRCIGLGGLYLCGLERAIITSMGTGTAMVLAERGKEPLYLGGTGVGGGTLMGLSKKLLGMDNVKHISDLAKNGDISRIDLRVSDISRTDIGTLTESMTASNFGNVSDLATKEDLALGIINMVFETVGMVSIFNARRYEIRDVILTGNLTDVPQARDIFAKMNSMFDMNFTVPKYAQFGTVIGAALAGCENI